jgi:hypothetical protein
LVEKCKESEIKTNLLCFGLDGSRVPAHEAEYLKEAIGAELTWMKDIKKVGF